MRKNIQGVGEVTVPSSPKEKLQNFWYHYKLHTALCVLLVIALVVCSLQLCTRESYDAYVLYAGSKNIGRTASDGDVAEIATVISSIKRIAGDYDENGEVSINFGSYYYVSGDDTADLNNASEILLKNDKETLTSLFEHSDYYLCFISVDVYEEYHSVQGVERFISLEGYKSMSSELEYYADNAIYLSSTPAAKLPGFKDLPKDTLICIRQPSILARRSDVHKLYLANAKEMLSNIISLQIN